MNASIRSPQYRCRSSERRDRARKHPTLNGIDFLEVLDQDAPDGSPRQRTLLVHCLKSIAGLGPNNVRIDGGARIAEVGVLWAHPASGIPVVLTLSRAEQEFFAAIPNGDRVLVVRTAGAGDFSRYRFRLVAGPESDAPALGFDPLLAGVDLWFKVDCASDLDCRVEPECTLPDLEAPPIDYLAKDFESFRRLMLDRMAVLAPEWDDRDPADAQVALVELLAWVGDRLSYYQDAVATEAYLETARRRVSVRRHAKLLDYDMHDGCNARAWVCFELLEGAPASVVLGPGTRLLTGAGASLIPDLSPAGSPALQEALQRGATVFETMAAARRDERAATLRKSHSRIAFHTWGEEDCCLPRGATRATLVDEPRGTLALVPGDLLLFEELIDPATGREADASPAHRHVVRLIAVEPAEDHLPGDDGPAPRHLVTIEWHSEDALPFALCLSAQVPTEDGGRGLREVAVARGNVLLADHGETRGDSDELISPAAVRSSARFRPVVTDGPITFAEAFDWQDDSSAALALRRNPRRALPAVSLHASDGQRWTAARDLLAHDGFNRGFVVETESDGTATLRFGDGVNGARPAEGAAFKARARFGNGTGGNVGAHALRRVALRAADWPTEQPMEPAEWIRVWNPLPAVGGSEPEPIETVREHAPAAFRRQERAVTEDDYATIAERDPRIQRAAGTFRWTGSWHTVFVTVDRARGLAVDQPFTARMLGDLDAYRIAGFDLAVDRPRFVALDIAMRVCVVPGSGRGLVLRALAEAFSTGVLADGTRGFFHPDNFSFGQPLYISRLYAAALAVPGVDSVDVTRFQRWRERSRGELDSGRILPGRLEILCCDSDPSFPDKGRIHFAAVGVP